MGSAPLPADHVLESDDMDVKHGKDSNLRNLSPFSCSRQMDMILRMVNLISSLLQRMVNKMHSERANHAADLTVGMTVFCTPLA